VASIRMPLVFEPGEKWEYGVNIDWVRRLVESVSGQTLEAYFRDKIFAPLGMKDSGYITSDEQRARQARVHQRQADGTLAPQPLETPFTPEFWSGGGPLYSTGRDYLTFLQVLLHGGSHNGTRILKPETVALMGKNHTGDIPAGIMKTTTPARSNDVDLFPGAPIRWGLGYMLNMEPGPNGRSAGTVSWGGIFNTYYWLDPAKRLRVLETQTAHGHLEAVLHPRVVRVQVAGEAAELQLDPVGVLEVDRLRPVVIDYVRYLDTLRAELAALVLEPGLRARLER